MFVSGLSISEFVLLPEVRILGMAYGTVVHVEKELELTEQSRLMKPQARSQSRVIATALSRLQECAAKKGAAGVIGVKIVHQPLEKGILEYTITGTAIAETGKKPSAKPFICTLSGLDYFLLVKGGYRPVGAPFGVSIYSQVSHQRVQQQASRRINVERTDFTKGLYAARKHAFDALHQEAAKLNPEGVIAVTVSIERKLHQQYGSSEGMVIKMIAMGTAVVPCPGRETAAGYFVPFNK